MNGNAVARAVHEALSATQGVTDRYSARGTHEGCGECCGRFLPLFPHEVIEMRHAARGLEIRPEQPGTVDMRCPLLGFDGRCMVYERRPTICRVYDCSRHVSDESALMRDMLRAGMRPGMEVHDMREVVS